MEKVVRKISLKDKRNYDLEYWLSKSPEERFAAAEELRKRYKRYLGNAYTGFQRVFKVIPQPFARECHADKMKS